MCVGEAKTLSSLNAVPVKCDRPECDKRLGKRGRRHTCRWLDDMEQQTEEQDSDPNQQDEQFVDQTVNL